MKKQSLIILGCIGLCACAYRPQNLEPYTPEPLSSCPTVAVRPEHKKIVQFQDQRQAFLIEIIGHEGHCYFDENTLKDKAVVSPRLKITRLSNTNVEDVHVSYYLETNKGPAEYLGQKTFFTTVLMPKGVNEIYYTPAKGELTAPLGKYQPDIYVGLNEDKADLQERVK